MKKMMFTLCIFNFYFTCLNAQTVLFEDDFESGPDNWDVDGYWDVVDDYAVSGTYSFHDSPFGTYIGTEVQTATMNIGVDLTTALDADVKFQAIIDLEEGFDFTYLDVSTDGGISWYETAFFNGEDMFDWTEFVIPLGGFVGYTDVRLRFRFDPDDYVEYDGMYIDDLVITKYNIDYSPPLIIHTPLDLYEGTLEENNINAEIIDASGILSTSLYYQLDGSGFTAIDGINTFGDNYLFIIPAQDAGVVVDYYIEATDLYFSANTGVSDTFTYISGNYIGYDNAVIDFVNDVGDLSASGYASCAVRITLDGITNLVGGVIQNYTDFTRPNDSIQIHIWDDDGGFPGDDLITPFTIFPEATLEEPNRGTKIDLRPYSAELSDITGDIYIGYSSFGTAWISQTTPGIASRSMVEFPGFGWLTVSDDYHFRVVTSMMEGAPVCDFTFDSALEPNISFDDISTGSPDSWFWDFGDGTTSTTPGPVHEFLSNGSFNVCLTVSNAIGDDTHCEFVDIDSYVAPNADYVFSGDPTTIFTDISTNDPTSWNWIFDDGATSTEQNPTHTFLENGIYNVCMSAFNIAGGTTECKAIVIDSYLAAPTVDFSFELNESLATFTDLSTNDPSTWSWDFGDGESSDLQNPLHLYDTNGDYEVCLIASNDAGIDTACKFVSVLVKLNQLGNLNMQVFPIPNDAALYIEDGSIQQKQISIFNILGEKIYSNNISSELIELNTTELMNGNYFIQIETNEGIFIQKFIVQHTY